MLLLLVLLLELPRFLATGVLLSLLLLLLMSLTLLLLLLVVDVWGRPDLVVRQPTSDEEMPLVGHCRLYSCFDMEGFAMDITILGCRRVGR